MKSLSRPYFLRNARTVAIEICENADGNYQKAEINAAYLTAQLLFELGLPSDAIKMHKDWSGKNCPSNMIELTKNSMGWNAFKNLVKQIYDQLINESKLEYVENIDEEFSTLINQLNYSIQGNMISQIPVNTTIQYTIQTLNSLNENIQCTIMNLKDDVLQEGLLASGYRLKVTLNEKECIFLISVKGDVNGDGEVLPTDYVLIKNHIMKTGGELKGVYAKAADYNLDNEILPTDYVQIKNFIMNGK